MQAETAVLLTDVVHEAAHPLSGDIDNYNPLMELIGDASLVLIGEASHGTHEFYRERAQITKRLIKEKGFTAVAVEADWPDAYRVNRYVQGTGSDAEGVEALGGFKRFPAWMWRNADFLDFAGLEKTQEQTLHSECHLSDFVEEQGATVGDFSQADLAGVSAREGAFLVTEQFRLKQIFVDGRAVAGQPLEDLVGCLGPGDLAARAGGDEFTVIFVGRSG